jgi:hypothetical protein
MLDEERYGHIELSDSEIRYGSWVAHFDHIDTVSVREAEFNRKEILGNLALAAALPAFSLLVIFGISFLGTIGGLLGKILPFAAYIVSLLLFMGASFVFNMYGYSPTRNPFKRDWLLVIRLREGYGLKTDWGRDQALFVKSDQKEELECAQRYIEKRLAPRE